MPQFPPRRLIFARRQRRFAASLAFTLIELLVVVSIIIVLASLLLPAYQSAQRTAKLTQCVANLSQIGSGMNAFAMDHRMYFTGDGTNGQSRWIHQVALYMGYGSDTTVDGVPVYSNAYQIPNFHCPLTKLSDFQTTNGAGNGNGCYGLNIALVTGSNGKTKNANVFWSYVSQPSIVQPSQTVLAAEKSYLSAEGYGASGPDINDPNQAGIVANITPYPPNPYGVAANHRGDGKPQNGPGGAANYLYCDGHVATSSTWIGVNAFNPWIKK